MMGRTLLLAMLIVLTFTLAGMSHGADDTERIAKLILRMGSADFDQRETASKELDAIGAPALPSLKKAATSNDVETRRRAEELIARIEKRMETVRLLLPTNVSVKFDKTPLIEAVGELAKRSGQRIALDGEPTKYASRTVTLEIKDMPFWHALDRFCEAAGLIEPGSVSMPLRVGSTWGRVGRAGPRQLPPLPPPSPSAISTQIVLADGKAQSLPTHYAGAARVRMFPPNSPSPATRTTDGELLFALGLGLETQIPLEKVLSLRIDRATDEHGQNLEQLGAAAAQGDVSGPVFLGNVNGQPSAIVSAAGQHPVQVKLKEGAKSAKLLKELTGHIGVEVRTPPETVITVENILKSAGVENKGNGPTMLKVQEITQSEDGEVTLKLTIETLANPVNNVALNRMPFGAQPIIRVEGVKIGPDGDLDLALVDARGGGFTLIGDTTRTLTVAATKLTHETTLTFKAKPDQGPASKLIFRTTRLTTMEIPFTLKDVPLP
jgi:hypothetical protein